MELKGSRTEANLMAAFAGESQARNKYTYYASKAKKDGFEQIAAIFEETANNEKEHAKIWFKYLHGGAIADTATNLEDAAQGENYEWTRLIAQVEKSHEERYRKLLANLKEDIVFKCDDEIVWVCRNCGYIHVGKAAPAVCPACRHPQAYFERKAENY